MKVEELAHFWSEWVDDNAPVNERGIYTVAAKDFLAKYVVTDVNEVTLDFDRAVAEERAHQLEIGYTLEHDDKVGLEHLLYWGRYYLSIGQVIKGAALYEAASDLLQFQNAKKRVALNSVDQALNGEVPVVTLTDRKGHIVGKQIAPGATRVAMALSEVRRILAKDLQSVLNRELMEMLAIKNQTDEDVPEEETVE